MYFMMATNKIRHCQLLCLGIIVFAGILLTYSYYENIFPHLKLSVKSVHKTSRIFVCKKYLSEICPLAKLIAFNLFSNSNVLEYVGQKSTVDDVLVAVCGCNQADLFKGIILYIDNASGKLHLPGLTRKQVVYIGSTLPTPKSLVINQCDIFFAITSFHLVFNTDSLSNLEDRITSTNNRFFLMYLSNYIFENLEAKRFIHMINRTILDNRLQPLTAFSYLNLINGSLINFQNAIEVIRKYRFTIIFENKNVNGYVGEKILLTILAGSVPVYIGTEDVLKLFNEDVIIYVDKKNPQKAIDRIVNLERNRGEYMKTIKAPVLKDGPWFLKKKFKEIIVNAVLKGKSLLHKTIYRLDSGLKYNTIKMLEQDPVHFYMYDDPDITLDTLEKDCPKPVEFSDKTDITLIKLFKKHPWRTHNASIAKLFVIPTPVYESYTCNPKTHPKRLDKSLSALIANPHFKRFGGRNHLLMTYHWRFGYNSPDIVIPKTWWKKLKEVVCTRFEYYGMSNWENFTVNDERRVPLSLFTIKYENSKRTIVVSYNIWEGIKIQVPNYDDWKNRSIFFWYHSRRSPSGNGGTPLRHLPMHKTDLFPGDVGFDINRKHWISGWTKSKFCLVIRGDTPSSHAFSSALASGCIPVIISDTFELVAMPHRELIPIESISIRIAEYFFLHNTKSLTSRLKAISEVRIRSILTNIKFVQHILLIKHPNCTLPNLILHEFQSKIENLFSVH